MKNMSAVEESLIASNHKLEPDVERYNLRPQRPPPPPPTQSQLPALRIEQTSIYPKSTIINIYYLSICCSLYS